MDYVCKLDYDPFLFMKVAKKKYGYNIVAPEFMKTVDGLWDAAKTVVQKQQQTRPNPLKPEFAVFGDDKTYNGLHFW